MIAETTLPTLLEDWQRRRLPLESEAPQADDRTVALIKVLDYLICRYEGTEASRLPARAILPQATVVNTRAMIVHHHVWSGVVAGVKDEAQAEERIVGVLHRMDRSSCITAECEAAEELDSANPFVEPENYRYGTRGQWTTTVNWAFRLGVGRIWAIRDSLRRSPFLPVCVVKYLAEGPGLSTAHHTEAIQLLSLCASRSVF